MKAYVGVTDIEWYRQLSAESLAHDEVNFWFPSPTQGFRALRAGEPFLFKTHLDRTVPGLSNRIVGVGLDRFVIHRTHLNQKVAVCAAIEDQEHLLAVR